MPKAGKRANDSILFGSAGYRFGLLPGFPDATSAYSLSAQNDTGKPATLYRPAVKALVLYQCQGRRVYDCKSYSSQEIYAEPIGVGGALGQIGSTGEELYIAEYRQSETMTHIACFDKKKKQFLFAGVTDNFNKAFEYLKKTVMSCNAGASGGVGLDHRQIFAILEEYFALDDAEIARREAEAELKRKKNAAKKAEKKAADKSKSKAKAPKAAKPKKEEKTETPQISFDDLLGGV